MKKFITEVTSKLNNSKWRRRKKNQNGWIGFFVHFFIQKTDKAADVRSIVK